jgi:hypothetical protein
MRVVQTAISTQGFRQPAFNTDKTTLLEDLALLASQRKCSLLVVPAGFWTVTTFAGCGHFVATARRIATQRKIAIVGGIDVEKVAKGGITRTMVQGSNCVVNLSTGAGSSLEAMMRLVEKVAELVDGA